MIRFPIDYPMECRQRNRMQKGGKMGKHVMKRRRDLEYKWILKGALFVQAYTAKLENGKTLAVYAHDFNDMEFFLSRLEVNESPIAVRGTDSDFVQRRRMLSYLPDKHGEPKSKPFWYRGRVYEVN